MTFREAAGPPLRTGHFAGATKRQVVAGSAVFAAGILAAAYTFLVEPRWLDVVHHTLYLPGADPGLNGVRLAQLSDFHFGMFGVSHGVIKRAVERARSWNPDLVALTGDFVHDGRWHKEANLFEPLIRRSRVFAVLGNHDHWKSNEDTAGITTELTAMGITVLENSAVRMDFGPRSSLIVAGVDDPFFARDDIGAMLTAVESLGAPRTPVILLAHDPDLANRAPVNRFALILSGHTHGGQIRLTRSRFRSRLEIGILAGAITSRYIRGSHVVRGNPLFVTNGLGVSTIPARLLARPQLALFTIECAPAPGADQTSPVLRETPLPPDTLFRSQRLRAPGTGGR